MEHIALSQVPKRIREQLLPSSFNTSRAKTAYGLLTEIKREILKHVQTYNQQELLKVSRDTDELCQTAFCRAGEACILTGTVAVSPENDGYVLNDWGPCYYKGDRGWHFGSMWSHAQYLLGLNDGQAEELFNASANGRTVPGTKAHARAGAAGITKFQKKYEKQLRATKVRKA